MLINSNLQSSNSGSHYKLNPFTSEVLHQVYSDDLVSAVGKIQAAKRAFMSWQESTLEQRLNLIKNILHHLNKNSEHYASYEALDQGLPLHMVKQFSILNVANYIQNCINQAEQISNNEYISPVGVVCIISSWNLSLRVSLERLVPALLAGNAAVVKVSSQSPVTAFILTELLEAAGCPSGLVGVVISSSEEVKNILLQHPAVNAVSFTGQTANATKVLQSATSVAHQQFKKVQLSAGSKNSVCCLAEPNPETLNNILASFLFGQGQLAWGGARLFILEKFESLWTEAITEYLSNLRPSESIEDTSLWTPIVNQSSVLNFNEINKTAIQDQAKLIQAPSLNLNNNYLRPTFTKDMSRCSVLQQDQVHTPFFILSTVKYPFDIPKYSNVSYFGMAAELWGESEKLAKVAASLNVGLLCYNKNMVAHTGPVSGVKQSAFGFQDFRFFGDFFSNVKIVS